MQEGLDCDRGAQYILQVNTVVESGAKIACLENVGNTALLNGGRAVKLLRKLFDKVGWSTHLKVLHVRHYGDPTNKSLVLYPCP